MLSCEAYLEAIHPFFLSLSGLNILAHFSRQSCLARALQLLHTLLHLFWIFAL
jgi:hypothetical protein